jgi:hypothetical protein
LGTGVAVGKRVGVEVRVAVCMGRGEAVDEGGAAGVDMEATWPDPHADRIMEIKITIVLQVNTLFIFIIHLFVL